MIRTGSRFGYWVVEWADGFDPSLADLMLQFSEAVIGNRIAIASCDSGPFLPNDAETKNGWTIHNALAISPRIQSVAELPTPGFDEWYVYDLDVPFDHHNSFVNRFGFSPLDTEGGDAEKFWVQVENFRPLHVLGAGTPTMFFATRDEAMFMKITNV